RWFAPISRSLCHPNHIAWLQEGMFVANLNERILLLVAINEPLMRVRVEFKEPIQVYLPYFRLGKRLGKYFDALPTGQPVGAVRADAATTKFDVVKEARERASTGVKVHVDVWKLVPYVSLIIDHQHVLVVD